MNNRKIVIEAGKRLLNSGLTVETWGNISIRNKKDRLIYITPSGMSYEELRREDIVVMNSKYEVVEGTRKPSIEAGLHIDIYNARSDVNAIVHTHPIYSQVFACLHRDIQPVIDEAAQVFAGTVYCAKYGLPGSGELAHNVLAALGNGFACLMANHGAVCVGEDINWAFKVSTVLEMTAQIYYMALSIGTPKTISEENVKIMREFVLHSYGQK